MNASATTSDRLVGEWPRFTVWELQQQGILRVEDGNHGESRPRSDEFVEDGTAFIRAADLSEGNVQFSTASKINEQARKRISKGIGAAGDVIISHKGTVGKIARASVDAPPFVCSPQTTFWRSTRYDVIDPDFLYVLMRSREFLNRFNVTAGETDMAGYVSLTEQRRIEITVPPIAIQKSIANIITPFDEKIAVNQALNEILDGMAKTIFKDWFIDFGPTRTKMDGKAPYLAPEVWSLFPDQLDQEGQPTGWTIRAVSEFADLKGGTQLAKERIFSDGEIPVFGGAGIMGFANDHNAEGFVIAVGRVGAYCGQFFHHQGRAWINNNASLVRPHPDTHAEWLFHSLRHADIETIKKGAAQPFVSNSDIGAMGLLWSSEELVRAYSQSVAPLILKSRRNQSETKTLTAIRDLLLPKLMSGEVQLKDAEQMTEAGM